MYKEICKGRDLATSRVLHNFTDTGRCTPSLDSPLSRLSRMSKVYREFEAKIHVVETKIVEINAPLNLCHSN